MQKNSTLNNIDLAITNFNRELSINPYNPDTYNNLACLYYRINQTTEAIYNYKKSLYLNPNNYQAHYNLANCYVKENLITDAICHYKESIQLEPNHINAIQNLGMLLVTIEEFEDALPYLDKAYTNNQENQFNNTCFGVSLRKDNNKYRARIRLNNKFFAFYENEFIYYSTFIWSKLSITFPSSMLKNIIPNGFN